MRVENKMAYLAHHVSTAGLLGGGRATRGELLDSLKSGSAGVS